MPKNCSIEKAYIKTKTDYTSSFSQTIATLHMVMGK